MTVSQSWALQQAIQARLTAQLAGQGPAGADVTVYDHVPKSPARVHCRIDGFNAVQRNIKSNKTEHFFTVHIFDDAGRGQSTVKQLQQTVVTALRGWDPSVTGASALRHEASEISEDDDGLTQHAFSRFSVHIGA